MGVDPRGRRPELRRDFSRRRDRYACGRDEYDGPPASPRRRRGRLRPRERARRVASPFRRGAGGVRPGPRRHKASRAVRRGSEQAGRPGRDSAACRFPQRGDEPGRRTAQPAFLRHRGRAARGRGGGAARGRRRPERPRPQRRFAADAGDRGRESPEETVAGAAVPPAAAPTRTRATPRATRR